MEVPQTMHHKKASKTSTRSRQHGTQVNLGKAIVTIHKSRTNLSRAPYKSQGCYANNTHIAIQLINQGHTIQSMHKQHQEWAINLSAYTKSGQQHSSHLFQPQLGLQVSNKGDPRLYRKHRKLYTTLLLTPKAEPIQLSVES